jgi:hypothetical protein
MYSRQDFGPSKLSLSGQQRLRCIRDRTLVPRSYLFWASSAFDVFEVGLWSLGVISFGPAAPSMYSRQDFGPSKLSLSGQQRLRCIRGRTLVPRSYLFRASSAFDVFEVGLWSLGVISFGPTAPSMHSRQDFGPSKLSLSGRQRLRCVRGIRSRTSAPRVISFGLAAPSRRLRQVFDLSSCFFRLNNTFRDPGSNFGPLNHLVLTCLPSYQRSSINMPEFWWHYTSSDAVCQIRR